MSLPNKEDASFEISSQGVENTPVLQIVKHSLKLTWEGIQWRTSYWWHVIEKCFHTLWNAKIPITEQLYWNDTPLLFKFWICTETSSTSSARLKRCQSCWTQQNFRVAGTLKNTCAINDMLLNLVHFIFEKSSLKGYIKGVPQTIK